LISNAGGLTIVDLGQLPFGGQPLLYDHRLDWFNFARRIHINSPDPYLFVVGTDTNNGGLTILSMADL
jgi:hypothetical protein